MLLQGRPTPAKDGYEVLLLQVASEMGLMTLAWPVGKMVLLTHAMNQTNFALLSRDSPCPPQQLTGLDSYRCSLGVVEALSVVASFILSCKSEYHLGNRQHLDFACCTG